MAINKVIYGDKELMNLTGDTVEADKLLKGITAHDKSGEIIEGTCTFDVDSTDADVTAAEILKDKTAYARGTKLTGTMPNHEAISGKITDKDTPYTVPMGFHDGSGTVGIDDVEKEKLIPGNIKAGVELLGVTGEYAGEADKVQSKTATPKTTEQTVLPDEGYDYLSQVVVAAIPYSETPNSAGGTTVTIG